MVHLQKHRGRLPELMQLEERLSVRMKKSRTEVRQIATRIENIERMLSYLVKEYDKSKQSGGGGPGGSGHDDGDDDPPPPRPRPARRQSTLKPPPTRQDSTPLIELDITPLPAHTEALLPIDLTPRSATSPTLGTHRRLSTSEA